MVRARLQTSVVSLAQQAVHVYAKRSEARPRCSKCPNERKSRQRARDTGRTARLAAEESREETSKLWLCAAHLPHVMRTGGGWFGSLPSSPKLHETQVMQSTSLRGREVKRLASIGDMEQQISRSLSILNHIQHLAPGVGPFPENTSEARCAAFAAKALAAALLLCTA